MKNFTDFKNAVRNKGGVWNKEAVFFTQFRDGYSAVYKPSYPNPSKDDCAISYNWVKKQWREIPPEQFHELYERS